MAPEPPDLSARLRDALAGPHGRRPSVGEPSDLMIVFGAAEPELAKEAAAAFESGLTRRIIFSGGIGKDSGALIDLGIPESVFLASLTLSFGVPGDVILIEANAKNGAENAKLSLSLAAERGFLTPGVRVCGLAPAIRSRRLYEELRLQAQLLSPASRVVGMLPATLGSFDTTLPLVQKEAAREIIGLHTMDQIEPPRIMHQPDFELHGKYGDLVEWALSKRTAG